MLGVSETVLKFESLKFHFSCDPDADRNLDKKKGPITAVGLPCFDDLEANSSIASSVKWTDDRDSSRLPESDIDMPTDENAYLGQNQDTFQQLSNGKGLVVIFS